MAYREEVPLKRDHGITFLKLAESVLDDREREGVRGIEQERYRFRHHLATAHFANMPVEKIASEDIARWLRDMAQKTARRGTGAKGKTYSLGRLISGATQKRALALAMAIFEAAGPNDRNLIRVNPCLGMKVKKRPGKEATKDVEVFLTLEEQRAIRECPRIPDLERFFILFAFGCGVRRGEQFNLELADVDLERCEVTVRFSADGGPPKNGNVETIPLFGYALEAARWQVARLETKPYPLNPLGLLWPTENGHRRKGKPLGGHFRPVATGGTHVLVSGKPKRVKTGGTHRWVDRFRELLGFAGITRHVRWHDMRHTCASALLQGQWGDPWLLAEVKDQLRHSSVAVTERYAHLGETALKKAAKKVTVGSALVSGVSEGDPGVAAISSDSEGVGRAGHDPATYGLKGPSILELLRALGEQKASDNPLVTNLATTLASLLESASKGTVQ
jgi:integrase